MIKTYRAGLGVGLLAEIAVSMRGDANLHAPSAVPECVNWPVLPRERVFRDYARDLLLGLSQAITN